MHNIIKEYLKQQLEHRYAEARLRQLEYDWEHAHDASIRTELASSLGEQRRTVNASQQTIRGLAQRIIQSPDAKPYVDGRRTNLLNQLTEIIANLHPSTTGLKLTRNQSMYFDNYLFQRIYLMLRAAIETDYTMHEIPHFMYSDDSSFDEAPMRSYLATMKDELRDLPLNSFLDLHAYLQRKEEGFFALTKQ